MGVFQISRKNRWKNLPALATPTMSRILRHLVGALLHSPRSPNVPFQPRRFSVTVLFFSPRTTFKGHVKKHTGISLVISPPNPKKREKGISMIHAKACSSSFPQGRSPLPQSVEDAADALAAINCFTRPSPRRQVSSGLASSGYEPNSYWATT